MSLKTAAKTLRNLWLRATDPRRVAEIAGERVVFRHLESIGFFSGMGGKAILEIGPKHGEDSLLLAALEPGKLMLMDLPEKTPLISSWLPNLPCPAMYMEANVLYLSDEDFQRLGTFDLVWCLGVLYHNVEQVRLLRTLFDLCRPEGRVVVESATTRNRHLESLNVVEIHWPNFYRGIATVTHLPSRLAIKSWMEMVGFSEVTIHDPYSRALAWQRAVLTGRRTSEARPYVSYADSGLNPPYLAGESTS